MGQRHFPETKEELNKLVEDLNINLGDIDTCLITNMSMLFRDTERTDFSGIESWDTSNVTDMALMFYRAKHFDKNINAWNVSKVENMSSMFSYALNFNQNLDSWNVNHSLTYRMFEGSPLQNNPPKWY